MDWSLVLVSQGIETAVDHSEEAGWGLLVHESEMDRALAILKQYQIENRRWPLRQRFHRQVYFDWASLGWLFLLIVFFLFETDRPAVRELGLMDSTAVSGGQWWRLFTAMFLHADLSHLASNAGIGFVLLGLTMGLYGTGIGLLAAFLAGAGGNVLDWLLFNQHRSLGASGMVMGCLGLLAIQSIAERPENRLGWKTLLGSLAAGLMLFVFMGLSPEADVVAHLGGFLSGLVIGAPLALFPKLSESGAVNSIAGVFFSALVTVTWWLALRGGSY